jgi:O-antigen/teichoic acid export membrane protein
MSAMSQMEKPKSRFSKNVMILTMGTAISQLIPFIVLPILQKYYYGPSDFALLASFIYFSEMIGAVGTFKLEFAIVVQKNDQSAREVAIVAMRIAIFVSFISLLLAFLFFQFNIIQGLYDIGVAIFWLPLVVLSIGMVQVSTYWLNRKQDYKRMSAGKFIQTSTCEGSKLLFGFSGVNFSGLIMGRVFGYLITGIWQGMLFMKDSLKISKRNFSIREIIRNNYQYIAYATPSVFIGALINFIYIELFLTHFGKDSSGMVSVAMTYVGAGLGMVAGSISQVYYGTIAGIESRSVMQNLYLKFLRNLFFMALFLTSMFWIFPEQWVVGILGSKWSQLMDYCRIISIWFGVWFIASSLSFIYMRLQKQGFMLMMDVVHVGMIFAGFYIGKWAENSPEGALWGFTIAQLIFYILAVILALIFIRKSNLLRD